MSLPRLNCTFDDKGKTEVTAILAGGKAKCHSQLGSLIRGPRHGHGLSQLLPHELTIYIIGLPCVSHIAYFRTLKLPFTCEKKLTILLPLCARYYRESHGTDSPR